MKVLKYLVIGASALVLAGLAFSVSQFAIPFTPQSTASLRFVGFISLPKAAGAGPLSALDYLTVHDRNLYVATIMPGAVYKVPLDGETLATSAQVVRLDGKPSAHGVAFDPIGRLGYISRSDANTVDVFDPETMHVVKSIAIDADADGIFYNPFSKLVYVANGEPKLASLIDPFKTALVGTIGLEGVPEYAAIDPTTHRLFQNLFDVNALAMVDLDGRKVVDRWPLDGCEGPAGMALDAVNRRLFIACQKNAVMAVFNMDMHRVTTTIQIGGGPDSIAYDPDLKRVYATGRFGVLTTVQQEGADVYQKVDSITTAFGAIRWPSIR
jgi:DNA-binding beta-propeller fold protein YncE